MRFDIYLSGQYLENYGDEHAPYWKFKGADTTVAVTNVGLDELEEAIARAQEMIRTGEKNYSNVRAQCSFDSHVLFPAGAHPDIRFAVENDLEVAEIRTYSVSTDIMEEDIEQYRDWCRYFGKDHLLDD